MSWHLGQSKFLFQSATLFSPSLFQEYFYKSQESLATVIDFVEEKVEKKKKKRKEGSEVTDENNENQEEECSNTSTHSSPLFPASRKRPKNLDPKRRLTPWMTGSAVWSKVTKSEKTWCQHFSFRAQHITIVQGSDSALHFQKQSFCPTV